VASTVLINNVHAATITKIARIVPGGSSGKAILRTVIHSRSAQLVIASPRAMLRTVIATALLGTSIVCSTASAGLASEHLHGFLAQLESLQADFRQVLLNDAGQAEEESSGRVYLSRPGRFRWDYLEPHPQLIVADGQQVWLYDEDLSQVTVRKQASTLADTPAALLTSTAPVEDNFKVVELDDRGDGSTWLSLTPKSSANNFDSISIAFSSTGQLQTMELNDSFGQTTRLEFSAIERNPTLDPALFQFTPPSGVDVIRTQ
jgi:outer membrane lipoprotein carrier protein